MNFSYKSFFKMNGSKLIEFEYLLDALFFDLKLIYSDFL
jgi:hypothetical protein